MKYNGNMGKEIFYAKVRKEDIAYIRFIFEGYEGVGNIRTLDSVKGLIEIIVSRDLLEPFRFIVSSLEREISFELIERPHGYESLADSV
jgi:hypothetical protein